MTHLLKIEFLLGHILCPKDENSTLHHLTFLLVRHYEITTTQYKSKISKIYHPFSNDYCRNQNG